MKNKCCCKNMGTNGSYTEQVEVEVKPAGKSIEVKLQRQNLYSISLRNESYVDIGSVLILSFDVFFDYNEMNRILQSEASTRAEKLRARVGKEQVGLCNPYNIKHNCPCLPACVRTFILECDCDYPFQ
jgi:hypothetical protein